MANLNVILCEVNEDNVDDYMGSIEKELIKTAKREGFKWDDELLFDFDIGQDGNWEVTTVLFLEEKFSNRLWFSGSLYLDKDGKSAYAVYDLVGSKAGILKEDAVVISFKIDSNKKASVSKIEIKI